MGGIDRSSILSKAKQYMNSSDARKRVSNIVDAAALGGSTIKISFGGGARINPSEAADKFIKVLLDEIQSNSDLSSIADSISSLTSSDPVKIGNNTYSIEISFDGDLTRESFYPDDRGRIENIAALFNSGYDAGKVVWGMWHGNRVPSLQSRPATNFINNAKETFISQYGTKYGVIDLEINEIYN